MLSNLKINKALCILLLIANCSVIYSQNIIFDLYGVLFTIPIKEQITHMGLEPLKYVIWGKENPIKFKQEFLNFLYEIPVKYDPNLQELFKDAYSGDKPMTPIVFLHQIGALNYKDALNLFDAHLESKTKISNYKKAMLKKASLAAFDLKTRKAIYRPIDEGINLLMRCANERDINGKRKHKLYVLSTMDLEMINHLKTTYPHIFNLFDGIVTSCDSKSVKPHSSIYNHLIKECGINPEESIFIDDQKENVVGAEKLGIKAIHCNSFDKVAYTLETAKIIKPLSITAKIRKTLTNKLLLLSGLAIFSAYYYLNRTS